MGNDNSGCIDEWLQPKKSKTEEEVRRPGWECLPAVILDNVFQYLSFKDVVNASSTCRNWRQSLYHPRSWQEVNFVIKPNNIPQAQYLRTMVGHIVTDATVRFNSMTPTCVTELILLLEYFTYNNNLHSLILEPSHCNLSVPDGMVSKFSRWDTHPLFAKLFKIFSQRPMTKLSIGGNEYMLGYVSDILQLLAKSKPEKVTTLGLATVKDDPLDYAIYMYEPKLFLPFQSLQILSIDYDSLNDKLLESLQCLNDLQRLVVHLHGIWEGHPGTSEEAWQVFRVKQPNCLLRLSLIHAFDEVAQLHDQILRDNMPLSHLKVLFCERMNQVALEKLIKYHDTFVSLMWVDSLTNHSGDAYTLVKEPIEANMAEPQNLILLAWLCKRLEEIVVLGYKYFEEDWIGIVKLRSNTLKKLEIASPDIIESGYYHDHSSIIKDVRMILGKDWSPIDVMDLHPVLLDPNAGDSDDYLMPIIFADLH